MNRLGTHAWINWACKRELIVHSGVNWWGAQAWSHGALRHEQVGRSRVNAANPAIYAQYILPFASVKNTQALFQHRSIINSTFNIITILTYTNYKLHSRSCGPGSRNKRCTTHTLMGAAIRAANSEQEPPLCTEHLLTLPLAAPYSKTETLCLTAQLCQVLLGSLETCVVDTAPLHPAAQQHAVLLDSPSHTDSPWKMLWDFQCWDSPGCRSLSLGAEPLPSFPSHLPVPHDLAPVASNPPCPTCLHTVLSYSLTRHDGLTTTPLIRNIRINTSWASKSLKLLLSPGNARSVRFLNSPLFTAVCKQPSRRKFYLRYCQLKEENIGN